MATPTTTYSDTVLDQLIADKHKQVLNSLKQTEVQQRYWLASLEDTIHQIEGSSERYETAGSLKWYNPIQARKKPSSLAEQLKVNAKFSRIPAGNKDSVSSAVAHKLWRCMQDEPESGRICYRRPNSPKENKGRKFPQAMSTSGRSEVSDTKLVHEADTRIGIPDRISLLSDSRKKGVFQNTITCDLHATIPKQRSKWLSSSVLAQCEAEIDTLRRPAYVVPFDRFPARRSFISISSLDNAPGPLLRTEQLDESQGSTKSPVRHRQSPKRGLRSIATQVELTESQKAVDDPHQEFDNHAKVSSGNGNTSITAEATPIGTAKTEESIEMDRNTPTQSSLSYKADEAIVIPRLNNLNRAEEQKHNELQESSQNTKRDNSTKTVNVESSDGSTNKPHGGITLENSATKSAQPIPTPASAIEGAEDLDNTGSSNKDGSSNSFLWLPTGTHGMDFQSARDNEDTTKDAAFTASPTIYGDLPIPKPSIIQSAASEDQTSEVQDLKSGKHILKEEVTNPASVTSTDTLSPPPRQWTQGVTTVHLSPSGSMEIVMDADEAKDIFYNSQGTNHASLTTVNPEESLKRDKTDFTDLEEKFRFHQAEMERLKSQMQMDKSSEGLDLSFTTEEESGIGTWKVDVGESTLSSSASNLGIAIDDQNLGELALLVEQQHQALQRLGII